MRSKRILIGAGLVLALMIALVLAAGYWTPSGKVEQSISVTVGHHTLTVAGLYKSVTQESLADGLSIKVDGHEIMLSGDQLTVDDKTQVLEPDQDVEIDVNDKGQISVKLVDADAGASGTTSQ